MEVLGLFVLWVLLAFVAGAIANAKGRSALGYFVLTLLIPLIGPDPGRRHAGTARRAGGAAERQARDAQVSALRGGRAG